MEDRDRVTHPTAEQPLIFLLLKADFISEANMSAYPLATVRGLVLQQIYSKEEYICVGTFSGSTRDYPILRNMVSTSVTTIAAYRTLRLYIIFSRLFELLSIYACISISNNRDSCALWSLAK
jgi:hypothetical protein